MLLFKNCQFHRFLFSLLALASVMLLQGCGGGSGGGSDTSPYTIGGTVSGLLGTGLVLQNNGGDDLIISADGSFTFATAIANPGSFSVSVSGQPITPEQTCTASNNSGNLSGSDFTNISINCLSHFTIGGTVTGLAGSGFVLQNNGADDLNISADGNFTFSTAIVDLSGYNISISSFPIDPTQSCSVSSSSTNLAGSNITDVAVTCVPAYNIGGSVTGLTGTGLVLQNSGGDDLSISADGSFTFATPLADLSGYNITIDTQPSTPVQTCSVTNESGNVSASNISNIFINCLSYFTIGGSVTGLTSAGLVLQNNGGDDLNISADGSFAFSTAIVDLSNYNVTVSSQPATETCVIKNSVGDVASAGIVDMQVQCNITSVSVAPGIRPINNNQNIVLSFDKSMNTGSLVLGGDLLAEINAVWSTTSIANDTLTLSPMTVWSFGVDQSIVVDVDNTNGQAIFTQTLNYDIYNGTLHFVSSKAADDNADSFTPATAKRNIQAAITAASLPAVISINAGGYDASSVRIQLKEGVSLMGGYNLDFTARNTATYAAVISSTSSNASVQADTGVTSLTLVDGLNINAGGSTAVSIGSGAEPIFRNNIINGGSANGFTYGVTINASNPVIENNTILGGRGNGISHGIFIANGAAPLIHNNVITGGTGNGFTYGIRARDVSSPVIRNNTIDSGLGFGINTVIEITAGITPILDNNILYNSRARGRCINVDATSGFITIRNNNLFACPSFYLKTVDGSGCAANDICIADASSLNNLANASNNVNADSAFLSPGGADNNISTVDDQDLHLSITTPISVTAGGLNGDDDGGWGFNTDKDEVSRPATGNAWSIGAYQ